MSKTVPLILVFFILLAACAPATPLSPQTGDSPGVVETPTTVPTEPSLPTDPPAREWPEAVLPVRDHIVDTLGIPAEQVRLVSAEHVSFRDGCLGVAKPDEMCLMVITPGYRVTVATPKGNFIFHMNESGSAIRLATADSDAVINPDS